MSEIVSEVAYFRKQQALCEEAARRGLSGFAITASHESITARMERGAERILRLIDAGRHEEALALLNTDQWYAEEPE
jgi:plasmid maintenance system killer protein